MTIAPVLVDYTPDPKTTNQRIAALNSLVGSFPAADLAKRMSSEVAAISYMLLETNTPERLKELFGWIIDDATKHRQLRKNRIQKVGRGNRPIPDPVPDKAPALSVECDECRGSGWVGHGEGGDTCGSCGGKGKLS